MNEPIISPLLVYLAGISENVQAALCIVSVIGIIASILMICVNINRYYESEKKYFKLGVCVLPVFCFILLIGTLIPDKTTLYQIAIAKMSTPENINKVMETGKTLKDGLKQDLIDIIKSVDKKEEAKK